MRAGRDAPPPALACRGLTVRYGARPVLRDLELDVAAGEAVAVLGPSGCGKTTLLYTIAGFVSCERGVIEIAGRRVADGRRSRPPEDRDVGVVFQNYALWPHMTALDTVAYPMRRDGLSRSQARRDAAGLLQRMGMAQLADRRPAQLSGGEQQRVGVARALARNAGLYLFDEPTAHLDTPLRRLLQEELTAQRSALGAAVLYATHDVSEAFALADRVALVRDGAVVQVAAPRAVYERPVDAWAARLTGVATVLEVAGVPDGDGTVVLTLDGVSAGVPVDGWSGAASATVLVRPEWGRFDGPWQGRVTSVRYGGADTDYRLATSAGAVEIRERGAPQRQVGDPVRWGLRRAWSLPGSPGPVSPVSGQAPNAPAAR